ncbi:unnamed protein product, partial [Mesorhabditis spiculigera]
MFAATRMNQAMTAAVIDQLGIEELHELQLVNKQFRGTARANTNAKRGRRLDTKMQISPVTTYKQADH